MQFIQADFRSAANSSLGCSLVHSKTTFDEGYVQGSAKTNVKHGSLYRQYHTMALRVEGPLILLSALTLTVCDRPSLAGRVSLYTAPLLSYPLPLLSRNRCGETCCGFGCARVRTGKGGNGSSSGSGSACCSPARLRLRLSRTVLLPPAGRGTGKNGREPA